MTAQRSPSSSVTVPPQGGGTAPGDSAQSQVAALAAEWLARLQSLRGMPPAFACELSHVGEVIARAAMADRSFFESPLHPVRELMVDFAVRAAWLGLQGLEPRPLCEQLREVAERISVREQWVRAAMVQAKPLEPAAVRRFRRQSTRLLLQRQAELRLRLRATVLHEAEQRTLDIALPAASRQGLLEAFLPLLVAVAGRCGLRAVATTRLLSLLEQRVTALVAEPAGLDETAWLAAARQALLQAGWAEHAAQDATALQAACRRHRIAETDQRR